MKKVIWGLLLFLLIIHQDYWFWNDGTLVFGFVPVGLFYHVCISIAAAATWFLATIFMWPVEEAEEAPRSVPETSGGAA